MFDFLIELDSEDLKLGVDGFCQGDMTIKGQQGSASSDGRTMMIFISLTQLLNGIRRLAKKEIKEYKFVAIEGGFLFYITNINDTWILTDKKDKIIIESSRNDFIQSIWEGVDRFYSTYRPLVKEVDSGITDFDNSIKKFKTQFSEILNYSEKSIKN